MMSMLRVAVAYKAGKLALPELRTLLGAQLAQPAQQISGIRSLSSGPSSESNVKHIESDADFEKVMKDATGNNALSVFDFTASWCGPCRAISPVVDQLSRDYIDVNFYKVDIDNEKVQKSVAANSVAAVPTFTFMRGGKKIATFAGADKRQLENNVINLRSLGA